MRGAAGAAGGARAPPPSARPALTPSPPPPPLSLPRARYEPIRSIAERFPEWLAVHAEELSKVDYDNYGSMYMTFQKLVLAYETDPDNFPRILELFQDLQDAGNPPLEIIKGLAPALELTADGMPAMMPGMGPGMPEPGVGGLPAASCSIA